MADDFSGLGPAPVVQQPSAVTGAVPGDFQGLGAPPDINAPQALAPPPPLLVQQGNINRGVVRGLQDLPEGGAQLATHAAAAAFPSAQPAATAVDNYIANQNATYNKGFPSGPPSVDLPRAAGQAIAGAPVAAIMPGAAAEGLGARIASGVATGAITGAMQPATPGADYWTQKAEQTGEGAAGGAIGPVVGSAVGRAISPNASVNPDLKLLQGAGVKPSIGQTLGGIANDVEQKLSDLPFVGDLIKSARYRGVETFNRGMVNRVLSPIGERFNPETPIGRQAIGEMHDKIDSAYNSILPNLTWSADPTFTKNISAIPTAQLLTDQKAQLGNFLADQFGKIDPNGTMSGQTFKEVDSKIGQAARNYLNAGDPDKRNLGAVFQQVQTELRSALARSNPQYADELSNINNAYAGSLRVQGAAASPGAKDGVFTPAQLSASVRSLDPSLRKGAFARGEAQMQDISDAGRSVLGDTVPNSGTPGRMLMSLPALALGSEHLPYVGEYAAPLLAGAAAAAGAYTKPGQAALTALASRRPNFAAPIASAVRGAGQAVGAPTAAAAQRYVGSSE